MKITRIDDLDFVIEDGRLRTLRLREEILDEVSDPERIRDFCLENDVDADILTFTQHIPDLEPRYPYHLFMDNLAVLPITDYDTWLKTQTRKNTRKRVRKLPKMGVRVEFRSLNESFALEMKEIFDETPIRRGRRYPYFQKPVQEILEIWSPDIDRCDFLACYVGDEMVGFIKLLYAKHYARASGTVTKLAHRENSPMNAIIAKAVEVCAEKGIPHLIYGKYVYSKRGVDGLAEFKRHNGFLQFDIPRYYVPITMKGRLAIFFRLHRGIRTLVPSFVIQIVGFLRDEWNTKKNIKHMYQKGSNNIEQ